MIYWFFYKNEFYHVQQTSSSNIYYIIQHKQERIAVTTSRPSSKYNSIDTYYIQSDENILLS